MISSSWAANLVAEELDGIVERVTELLDAGWRKVLVITDHGWLLVPGATKDGFAGLPRREPVGAMRGDSWAIPKSRCRRSGWFWNPSAEAAIAPDITAFVAGCTTRTAGVVCKSAHPDAHHPTLERGRAGYSLGSRPWNGNDCVAA